ncbi:N-(5'-phosphoribosyl)anthranilate isomerase [compost metagenome]
MIENSLTSVKICGLQSVEMLASIAHLPIDHIGFVFAKSKRRVTPEQASTLIQYLQNNKSKGAIPLSVGVFVNPSEAELSELLAVAPLDVVQLHGQESPEFCGWVKKQFGVQVFKVVSVQKTEDSIPTTEAVASQLNPYLGYIDGLLLDTHDPVYGGGSGITFAWDCIPVYQEWTRAAQIKLLVAGGLTPENVSHLVETYAPDGVDVSSGVEIDGTKDINKITSFVERVNRSGTST